MPTDPMTLTDARLKELAELCEKATEGPWERRHDTRVDGGVRLHDKRVIRVHGSSVCYGANNFPINEKDGIRDWANMDFIAEARTALPELIEEVNRLREQERTVSERYKADWKEQMRNVLRTGKDWGSDGNAE